MGAPDQRAVISSARTRASVALVALLLAMMVTRSLFESPSILPRVPPHWLFALAGVAAIPPLLLRTPRLRGTLLTLCVMLLGAAWWQIRTTTPHDSLAAILQASAGSPTIITVQGRILDRPDASNQSRGALAPFIPYTPAARFRLDVHRVLAGDTWLPASGTLRVRVAGVDGIDRPTITGQPDSPGAGDLVTVTGQASPIMPPDNPSEPDARLWSAQEGLAGSVSVHDPDLVAALHEGDWCGRAFASVLRARAHVAHLARSVLSSHQTADLAFASTPSALKSQEARALLLSLVLGVDELRQDQVQQRFTRIGVVHVLAISGYHVAVLAMLVGGLVRLTGDHARLEPLAIASAVMVYTLIVPPSAPVLRASICILALLISRSLGRRYDHVCVLLWTAFLLALWKPVEAFTLGYVLSIGLCTLLMWTGDRVHARLAGPRIKGLIRPRASFIRRGSSALGRYCTATLLCWAVSAPIIAWWTGWLSPVALLASLVIVPVVSLLLGAGFVALLSGAALSLLWPSLGLAWSSAADAALESVSSWTLTVIDLLDAIPLGSLRLPPLSLAWSIAASAVVLYWFTSGRRNHRGAWLATTIVLAWLAIESHRSWRSMGLDPSQILRADALSVGDGLAVVLTAPADDGSEAILVDAGSSRTDLGLRAIPTSLRALGAWRIHTAMVLGVEPSHFSFLPDVAESIGIRRVLVPRSLVELAGEAPGSPQQALLELLRRRSIDIIQIDETSQLELGSRLRIVFSRGQSALRASVTRRDPHNPRPLLLISHDAPATASTTDAVIAAGNGASRTGILQFLRETHAESYVLSTSAPHETTDPDALIRTSSRGHIRLTWMEPNRLTIDAHHHGE